MAFTDEDKAKMDAAGDLAHEHFDTVLASLSDDLTKLDGANKVIGWFAAHYMAAGYKRLGRILVGEAKGWTK